MCMEYWNGWFDHWYEEHHTRTSTDTAQVLDEMLSAGASVNFYMFHGGTNFGFTNGANYDDRHAPTVTSYDYDAPLNEAGDLTPKYFEVKEVLEKHFGKAPAIPVGNLPKAAYGEVALTEAATLFDSQEALGAPIRAAAPLTMEELGQDFGFVLYTTELRGPFEELPLVLDGVHDRALIYIDGQFRGVKQRDGRRDDDIRLGLARGESVRLDILVENMGRVNYGRKLRDEKGLTGGVRLGQRYHFGWSMTPMPLDDLAGLRYAPWETGAHLPAGAVPGDGSGGHLPAAGRVHQGGGLYQRVQPGPVLEPGRAAEDPVSPRSPAAGRGERAGDFRAGAQRGQPGAADRHAGFGIRAR